MSDRNWVLEIRGQGARAPIVAIPHGDMKVVMNESVEQIAADWIAYARYSSYDDAPEQVRADAMSMTELPVEDPEKTWLVILRVISNYTHEDVFSSCATEAQRVIGLVAAGQIEDLLGYHGKSFIKRIEAEAEGDRRMAWALGGVWQFTMTDDIWARVQKAAGDNPYWRSAVPQ